MDSELKSDWKVEFIVGRGARQAVKINEEIIAGYKIIAVNEAKDVVTVESSDGKSYNMPMGEVVEEEIPTAQMLYLASRLRNSRKVFVVRKIGEEFFLEKPKNGVENKEYYRILSGSGRDDLIIGKLDEANGKVLSEFNVKPLDMKKDFIPEVEGSRSSSNRGAQENQPGMMPRRRQQR